MNKQKKYYWLHKEECKVKARDYRNKVKNTEKYKMAQKKRNIKMYKLRGDEIKLANRIYRKQNSELVKRKDLLRAHKITNTYYQELLENSGGQCSICKKRLDLYIDHDHVSGEIRGMLCRSCNLALGFFRDDVLYMKNAIDYLNNWRKNNKLTPKLNIKKGDIKS